jgi:hypothetical protein
MTTVDSARRPKLVTSNGKPAPIESEVHHTAVLVVDM